MLPAVNNAQMGDAQVFYYVLIAYFIVALGFSLQQTAAQPFAISLGDPAKGSHRLNLAGGVEFFWHHHWSNCSGINDFLEVLH